MTITRAEIETQVRMLIVDSLAVRPDEVLPSSRLTDDLGANSLDFVDLVFGIEKAFAIRLRDSELDFLLRLDFSSPGVMRDGFLTPETVARAGLWLDALNAVPDASRVRPGDLFSAVTVDALCGVIERQLRRAGS